MKNTKTTKHETGTDETRMPPIAIVGLSCLFPKADGTGAFWSNLKNGLDAITEIPPGRWKPEDYYHQDPKTPDMTYAKRGGFLSPLDFDPLEFGISPNDIEATDTSQLLGLVAARRALDDAGISGADGASTRRVSVILGVTGSQELVIPLGARLGHPIWRRALKDAGVTEPVASDVVRRIADSYVPWKETSFPGLLGNVIAGRIANRLNLGGTNCVVDAACASSLGAVHLAALELAAGRADAVLTGGVDTFNDIFMYMCFSKTPALSPTGDAKPFDAGADGTILGEGIGMLVLKRLEDAEKAGDRIYAVLKGLGASSDGRGTAIYEPSAEGQARALRSAYRMAQIAPETIGLVEAHGTGTKVGDATEIRSLAEVYSASGRKGSWCAVGSVKSMIGHTKASAGVAGLIKTVLALQNKVLPPTLKVRQPAEALAPGKTPFYVNTRKRPWLPEAGHPRRAAVSAFGFGGSNFHCVVEEHDAAKPRPDWDGETQILAFSGHNKEEISTRLAALKEDLSWETLCALASESRASFDAAHPCRLLAVFEHGKTDLAKTLAEARNLLESPNGRPTRSSPKGVYFGSGPRAGKLAALFPGQGSQYVGMLRDLTCQFPAQLDTLAEADAVFLNQSGKDRRLSDFIYPHPAFDPATETVDETALRSTDVAQPAIGAVSLGALRVLSEFGVRPEAAAGHSYGELTALCSAGRFDADALHRLSVLRGRLMAEGGGDRGSMLAVLSPTPAVESALQEGKLDLVLANRNAPDQVVLSGATAEIERAAAFLSEKGLRTVRLPVSAAFHSPLVAYARVPFEAALKDVAFAPAAMPVFANSTAEEYPEDPEESRKILAGQLARPVEFVREIEQLHAAGVRTFLEIGPGARLTGLVKCILGDRDFEAVAVDASGGKRSGIADLARALAWLASRGFAVRLEKWDDRPKTEPKKKPAFTIPLSGNNYVSPQPPRPPVKPAVARAPSEEALSGERLTNVASKDGGPLAAALRLSQQNLEALQSIQEQTARLHERFLESQETALRTIQALVARQQGTPLPAAPAPRLETPRETAPAPQPAVPAPARPNGNGKHADGKLEAALLDIVSQKTGYPAQMLKLDMNLDSDLGIDSIKRVEILSSLQERFPELPPVKPAQVGTLKTLRQVAELLAAHAPAAAPQTAAPARPNGNGGHADGAKLEGALLDIVAQKTGYPAQMLKLDMNLDSDLGIDSIKRVEILSSLQERFPELPPVKPAQVGTLKTLRQVAELLGASAPMGATSVFRSPERTTPASPKPNGNGKHSDGSQLESALLDIVAQKTGYPAQMLKLDMNLDSDLGIDSIKRVEILSSLQERFPELPPVKPAQVGTLKTLRQVAELLAGSTAAAAPSGERKTASASGGDAPLRVARLYRGVLEAVSLHGDRDFLGLPKDLEFWITAEDSGLAGHIAAKLGALGHKVRLDTPEKLLRADAPTRLGGLIFVSPPRGGDAIVKQALLLARNAARSLQSAAEEGSVFLTISRLDGSFGLAGLDGSSEPAGGALAGLSKTASHEWPGVSCKALDVDPAVVDLDRAAAAIVEEMSLAGPLEVGIGSTGRRTLSLTALELPSDGLKAPLAPGDVVLVTGGARGITAEAAVAAARAFKPKLILLGRSPLPAPEPAWLAGLETEAEIKKALLQQGGPGLSPKALEERYRTAAANREMLRNLERIREAGAEVAYRAVDIRDAAAVKRTLAELSSLGPVRGLLHGAGVLADRLIEEKTEEQFDQVYGTKVLGLRAILDAVDAGGLKAVALFSSSTGRFGRKGQVDYAMANEALNKMAQRLARALPACRVVSFDWGPWEGGMVTPALRRIFEAEGVGLIPLTAGAELLTRELQRPGPTEVVVLGSEPLPTPKPAKRRSGGRGAGDAAESGAAGLTLAFERTLDVKSHPFLESHVMDEHAVLPVAVMVEWLAHGAMHGHPGLSFIGFDDLRILKGVVIERDGASPLRVLTAPAREEAGVRVVPVELRGRSEKRDVLHARGRILLADRLPEPGKPSVHPRLKPFPGPDDRIYHEPLFHGPDLRGIRHVEGCSEEGIASVADRAPAPSRWIRKPLRSRWIADPLALDCAFQLMIVWSFDQRGAGSLPVYAGSYRQFRAAFPEDGVRIAAAVTDSGEHRAVADIEFLDRSGALVARLDGYECVIDASLNEAFRRNRLPAPTR